MRSQTLNMAVQNQCEDREDVDVVVQTSRAALAPIRTILIRRASLELFRLGLLTRHDACFAAGISVLLNVVTLDEIAVHKLGLNRIDLLLATRPLHQQQRSEDKKHSRTTHLAKDSHDL